MPAIYYRQGASCGREGKNNESFLSFDIYLISGPFTRILTLCRGEKKMSVTTHSEKDRNEYLFHLFAFLFLLLSLPPSFRLSLSLSLLLFPIRPKALFERFTYHNRDSQQIAHG